MATSDFAASDLLSSIRCTMPLSLPSFTSLRRFMTNKAMAPTSTTPLARPITHAELTRVDHRDGGTLADVAERVLTPLLASSASHAPPEGSEALPAPELGASEGDIVLVF